LKTLLTLILTIAVCAGVRADEKDKKLKVIKPTSTQQAALDRQAETLDREIALIQERAKAAEAAARAEAAGLLNGIGISLIGPRWRDAYKLTRQDGEWVFEELPKAPASDKKDSLPSSTAPAQGDKEPSKSPPKQPEIQGHLDESFPQARDLRIMGCQAIMSAHNAVDFYGLTQQTDSVGTYRPAFEFGNSSYNGLTAHNFLTLSRPQPPVLPATSRVFHSFPFITKSVAVQHSL
jgi:hypothetical protein